MSEYVGLMSSSSVVKSPTLVAVVPTSVLVPAVLARTWRRSGKMFGATSSGLRVQKLMVEPFAIVTTGVRSQLLIVPVPAVLL